MNYGKFPNQNSEIQVISPLCSRFHFPLISLPWTWFTSSKAHLFEQSFFSGRVQHKLIKAGVSRRVEGPQRLCGLLDPENKDRRQNNIVIKGSLSRLALNNSWKSFNTVLFLIKPDKLFIKQDMIWLSRGQKPEANVVGATLSTRESRTVTVWRSQSGEVSPIIQSH